MGDLPLLLEGGEGADLIQEGQCVEGARLAGATMAVRDSKDPQRGTCLFRAAAWHAFVDGVTGEDTPL
ncbi:DUF397 domain-containing protein [Streptomyces sp. NBC_01433]|uniref:DUF397 domain-containing protein n=1 Tax=Streptomyces sp. NBC_01433 TaxID=2903864 RepID=UPI002253AA3E|nr:DUF397 domain-containing protein [Streptomyces sp. NBC_01433]MCX4677702.1 DUF397 domain-containing protein [Streptomyces sp. NBC_01433]